MSMHVKERAETLASGLGEEQQAAIRALGEDLHRLNRTMARCVEAGLSVELQRSARHHALGGYWGDLLVPAIVRHG